MTIAGRQFQFKMVSAERRISAKKIGKLKYLLKGANRLYAKGG